MKKTLPAILLATLVLAACSPKVGQEAATPAGKDTPVGAANAEFARLQAQGTDATAREFTKLEYALTRSLMKAGGLDTALGGEAKADAALTELFVDYERKARALQAELPKAFVPANEGGGGGMGADGWGGAAASTVLGGAQADTAAQAWERGQDRGETNGHAESNFGGDNISVVWTQDTVTLTTEVKADIAGIKGKVKTTVKMKTCPDAEGKVVAEFESVSRVAAGGGSASTTLSSSIEKHVDDDANLIEDQGDMNSSAQQSTDGGDFVDVSDTISTSTGEVGSKVNGRGGSASDQDVQAAQFMARMGRFAAYQTMLAAQKAWQSGQCIDLQVRSDPAKRKGAKPNTAYTLFAEPRAKSDGAPTRGTVKATLSGEHMLNSRDKKVPADAQFDYQNPEKKDQSATIDFEARSKRGVGKATLEFDTKKSGYRVTGGGGDPVDQVVCDIDHSFVLNGKLFGVEFSGGKSGSYKFVRTPNIPGLSWKAKGGYSIVFPDGEDKPGSMTTNGGGTTSAGGTSRHTTGGETFTLTPAEECSK